MFPMTKGALILCIVFPITKANMTPKSTSFTTDDFNMVGRYLWAASRGFIYIST